MSDTFDRIDADTVQVENKTAIDASDTTRESSQDNSPPPVASALNVQQKLTNLGFCHDKGLKKPISTCNPSASIQRSLSVKTPANDRTKGHHAGIRFSATNQVN